MIDPYQAASIYEQSRDKKIKKKRRAYISAMVGMIVGVAGVYFANILFNLLEKRKFSEIFKVTNSWQVYFASVIAGGINGILVVFLPPKLYRFAAVIVITVLYEVIAGLSNQSTLDNNALVRAIVRDIFLIFFIVDLYKKLFKDYTKNEKNNNDDDPRFDELLSITLISSIVLNIGIITTKTGLNSLLGI